RMDEIAPRKERIEMLRKLRYAERDRAEAARQRTRNGGISVGPGIERLERDVVFHDHEDIVSVVERGCDCAQMRRDACRVEAGTRTRADRAFGRGAVGAVDRLHPHVREVALPQPALHALAASRAALEV